MPRDTLNQLSVWPDATFEDSAKPPRRHSFERQRPTIWACRGTLQRSGGPCQDCGSAAELEFHRPFPEDRRIAICHECHIEWHR